MTAREKKWVFKFAEEYDFDLVKIVKKLLTFKDEKGKEVIKDSRYETIKRKSEGYKEIYLRNSKSENFANWFYENLLLGYTYDITLRDIFQQYESKNLMSISTVSELEDENVFYIGRVDEVRSGTSRNGNDYIKMTVSDDTSAMNTMIFSKRMENSIAANNNKMFEKGDIVIVSGTKKDDVVFADKIGCQTNKVYTKLSELK